jgi:hypothetical protein
VVGAAAEDEGDGLRVLDVLDEDALVAADVLLGDGAGEAEVVGFDVVERADDVAAGSAGETRQVGGFRAADRENTLLREVVLGHVVDAVTDEDDVGADVNELVDHLPKLLFLLIEELLKLVGIGDVDLGVDLGLADLECAVEQRNLGVLDAEGHVLVDALFVHDDALDEFGVVDRAADDLLDGDVVDVDAVVVPDREDGVDDEFGEQVLRGFRALAGHRRLGDLDEGVAVVRGDLDRVVLEDLLGLLRGLPVALRDRGGVNVLVDEFLGLVEELTGDDDRGGGPVGDLVLLGLGDLDDHVRRGVVDVHLAENGDAVVGDDDGSAGVDEHLVHPFRTERGPYGFRDRLAGGDVHRLGVLTLCTLGVLAENDHRLTLLHSLRHNHSSIVCDSI